MDGLERLAGTMRALGVTIFIAMGVAVGSTAVAQPCEQRWAADTFGIPGVGGLPSAAVMFDDGDGPALYVGGDFKAAGFEATGSIARWDGAAWSSVGDGLEGEVHALAVFDDGTGPALHAARTRFTADGQRIGGLARWDGRAWSALEGDIVGDHGPYISSLQVFDDGDGPALYVGGEFTRAGEAEALNIARWDGNEWSALRDGVGGFVRTMAVWEGGPRPVLVVGGKYVSTTGAGQRGLVTWDGADWGDLGSGIHAGRQVRALAVYDDGDGPALYAGGSFLEMDGQPAPYLARWDGATWSAVGDAADGQVVSLAVADTGDGPSLFVAGEFERVGSLPTGGMARWDGAAWHALGDSPDGFLNALAPLTIDGQTSVVACSVWLDAEDIQVSYIARWDGHRWRQMGSGLPQGTGGGRTATAHSIAAFDDGDGPALYASGEFQVIDGVRVSNIAKWDGRAWSALDSALGTGLGPASFRVAFDMLAFDDGSGPALYVGGDFRTAGGVETGPIARWDGRQWSAVGQEIERGGRVHALGVFDDGSGPALYAGGQFDLEGGEGGSDLARWDGQRWRPLSAGRRGPVHAIEVFDDGGGPDLYVAGGYQVVGEDVYMGIARWDGRDWSDVGGGLSGTRLEVRSLCVYHDPAGPALYAGGRFTWAGGVAAHGLAVWDGATWSATEAHTRTDDVHAMAVFDDTSGPALYVGGHFTDGQSIWSLARWDGLAWTRLGQGDIGVLDLASFDDGHGPALYAGGSFTVLDGVATSGVARYGCERACPPDLDADGALTVFDFLAFLNLFDAGDLSADFDGDGELTAFDFLAFQTAFDAGCH